MTKRRLIFVPAINPNTFVFFFSKGMTGRSYSVREYPEAGGVILRYAREFSYTDDEVLAMATWSFDALPHDVNDVTFWRSEIAKLNRRYLRQNMKARTMTVAPPASQHPITAPHPLPSNEPQVVIRGRSIPVQYPILSLDRLLRHPTKGRKPQDIERMLTSPRSEDYVTWNVVELLRMAAPEQWWRVFLQRARDNHAAFGIGYRDDDHPALELWQHLPAPRAYEQASRHRMARSGNPTWVARSHDPKAVEGHSEIDLIIQGRSYLLFVEAKLDSDISMTTTYDPARNQIVRNIDVLLDVCRDCVPAFCMLVKDKGPGRAYVQFMREYQRQPHVLAQALPHRNPADIERVASNLAIVCWDDLLPSIQDGSPAVIKELERRIGVG